MYCTKCGVKLKENANFCISCGNSVKKTNTINSEERITDLIEDTISKTDVQQHESKIDSGKITNIPIETEQVEKTYLFRSLVIGIAIVGMLIFFSSNKNNIKKDYPKKTYQSINLSSGGVVILDDKIIKYNNKPIYKSKTDYLSLVKHFVTDNSDVLLISETCGGSVCIEEHRFLTIAKSGSVSASKILPGHILIESHNEGNMIKLIMSNSSDSKYNVIYNQGRIKSSKMINTEPIIEDDLRKIYEVYKTCSIPECKTETFSRGLPPIGGCKNDWNIWSYYKDDHRLNMKVFNSLCKRACKSQSSISYEEFIDSVKK